MGRVISPVDVLSFTARTSPYGPGWASNTRARIQAAGGRFESSKRTTLFTAMLRSLLLYFWRCCRDVKYSCTVSAANSPDDWSANGSFLPLEQLWMGAQLKNGPETSRWGHCQVCSVAVASSPLHWSERSEFAFVQRLEQFF